MKRSTKDKLAVTGYVIVALAIVTLLVSCEVQVWQECRQTNSWLYCMRVLSK
jgi:hypothetical protein